MQSEVQQFRQQQALLEQAAHQGLHGSAIVASHDSIEKRMEQGGKRLLKMLEEGKYEEVALLMEERTWAQEERNCLCK